MERSERGLRFGDPAELLRRQAELLGELGRITGDAFGHLTRHQMAFAERLGELMREARSAMRGERPDPVAVTRMFQQVMDAWIHHLHAMVETSLEAQRRAMELLMQQLFAPPAGGEGAAGSGSTTGGGSAAGGRGAATE